MCIYSIQPGHLEAEQIDRIAVFELKCLALSLMFVYMCLFHMNVRHSRLKMFHLDNNV